MYGEPCMGKETWEEVKKDPREWYELSNPGWTNRFAWLRTGIRVSYCVMGPENGAPVFLCHGNADCRICWSRVAPILANLGFRVIVPEKRGHGLSDRPEPEKGYYDIKEELVEDVVALMDHLHIEKASFVGHSAGGYMISMLAVTYPERVKSVTLVCSGGICPVFRRGYEYHGEADLNSLEVRLSMAEAQNKDDYEFYAGEAKYLIESGQLDEYMMIAMRHEFSHPKDFNVLEENKKVKVPVQIFRGTEDPIITQDVSEQTRDSYTNTTVDYIVVEGGTHCFFWDTWEELWLLISHLVPFLQKVSSDNNAS